MDLLYMFIEWIATKGVTMPVFGLLRPETLAIMIPITTIIGGIAVAIVAIIMSGRKKELEHKERLIAMEKGVGLPELPIKPERPAYLQNRSAGLVLTFLGIALTIAIWVPAGAEGGVWGLIPLAIGIGLLVSSVLERKETKDN
jgi:hypothetical protein